MATYVIPFPNSTSTVSSVTASTASIQVLAPNNNRGKFLLSLSGSVGAYVALTGSAASSSTASFYLESRDQYEDTDYKGAVNVVFLSGSASTVMFVTEFNK